MLRFFFNVMSKSATFRLFFRFCYSYGWSKKPVLCPSHIITLSSLAVNVNAYVVRLVPRSALFACFSASYLVVCFPTPCAGCMFSHALFWLYVFPRFVLVVCFPALCMGMACMFYPVRLSLVVCFPVVCTG